MAADQHLDPIFSPRALEEAARIEREPDVDNPALVDLTGEPFFAIDNPGSRDIDQAMRLSRRPGGGFVLEYALADMSHFVKPGMALFDEAMKRGASFYLPGVSVPMQPPSVCEGGVSLNAHEVRRAVVVTIEVDRDGNVQKTSAARAKIKSRAQLTYPGVSAFLEKGTAPADDERGEGVPKAVLEQLPVFRDLGEALRKSSRARGVVDPDRREMRIGLRGARFFLHEADDNLASKLNAELSIVANVAAASALAHPGIPGIEVPGIYRVHPPPGPAKLRALRRELSAVVDGNGAPASWKWRNDETLAAWVDRLKALPSTDRERALAQALQAQIIGIQVASEYAREPGLHSGLMVEGYGRFTAPMREVVGLVSHATLMQLESLRRVRALGIVDDAKLPALWDHMLLGALVDEKELAPDRAALAARCAALEGLRGDALAQAARAALAALAPAPPLSSEDKGAVERVLARALDVGNKSRMKQKQCDAASLRLLFDDLFLRDLHGVPGGDPSRPSTPRSGTVTAVSPGKIVVHLDEPDVEVKLGRGDLGDGDFRLERDGAELCCGARRLLVGQPVEIRATHHDGEKLHFALV